MCIEPSEKELAKRGYAPGGYVGGKCDDCGCKLEMVEKRSRRCKLCAIKKSQEIPQGIPKIEYIDRIKSYFKPPFKYDKRGQMIWDANMEHVLDIRGWGAIQYLEEPHRKQDSIGEYVSKLLNDSFTIGVDMAKKGEESVSVESITIDLRNLAQNDHKCICKCSLYIYYHYCPICGRKINWVHA